MLKTVDFRSRITATQGWIAVAPLKVITIARRIPRLCAIRLLDWVATAAHNQTSQLEKGPELIGNVAASLRSVARHHAVIKNKRMDASVAPSKNNSATRSDIGGLFVVQGGVRFIGKLWYESRICQYNMQVVRHMHLPDEGVPPRN